DSRAVASETASAERRSERGLEACPWVKRVWCFRSFDLQCSDSSISSTSPHVLPRHALTLQHQVRTVRTSRRLEPGHHLPRERPAHDRTCCPRRPYQPGPRPVQPARRHPPCAVPPPPR